MYERSDVELKGRGAGIVSHQELLDILTESGAGIADLGVHVEDRVLFDNLGGRREPASFSLRSSRHGIACRT